jgi:hypothetical protein
MKKIAYFILVIVVLFFSTVLPAQARGHGHVFFGGSVLIGPGWGPWWWGAPAYPYYGWEPPVVEEQTPVYEEPMPQPENEYYWYFCPESRNYYPYVKRCPKGWLKVVPSPAPPDFEEE